MTRLKWIVLAVLSCVVSVGVAGCDPVKVAADTDGGGAGVDATPGTPDAAPVQCTESSQCASSSTGSVCDGEDHVCRGCQKDSECASAATCVEATGVCVGDVDTAFVTMSGADNGSCTRAQPCATIAYAVRMLGQRSVVHVLGGSLFQDAVTLNGVGHVVLDGEDTTLMVGTPVASIQVSGASDVIVEGFRVTEPTSVPGAAVIAAMAVSGNAAKLRLHKMIVDGSSGLSARAELGATMNITNSQVGSLTPQNTHNITCPGSTLTVTDSVLETTIVGDAFFAQDQGACKSLTVRKNRFESASDGSVHTHGGKLIMENNLIIHRMPLNDSVSVGNCDPGSIIRFNTIVNTTPTLDDGAALSCDNTVQITSNVFAYNSKTPITGTGCVIRYSVFDTGGETSAGIGNRAQDIGLIFVDRADGDYHLAPGSVARGAAEPGAETMVLNDIENQPRPNPAGTNADCGAFEAP